MKKLWAKIKNSVIIAAIGAAVGAALLAILSRKKDEEPVKDASDHVADLAGKVNDIQSMTDEEIVTTYQTPKQEETKNDIVNNQVDKAIADADKYKRKKS